ncbi:MFS transporter [Oceanicoccus sp. KOV_DT_Chl]|uniref:MFS transporter n=1 Tax=Oceanicoccus sp. KOV_DT_Chl TaxID=1904639 RepID=UPI00190E9E06|nr:MFS transporter [Oceanicoccus sp. KOV_DT_Chl]
MVASLFIFFIGGGLLTLSTQLDKTWLGFALLFLIAATGRFASSVLLTQMHDPDNTPITESRVFADTLRNFKAIWQDKTFRHYSLFVAGMQGMVAISAPYFAVYMLQDLQFSYFQFVTASVVSIVVQFLSLRLWGRFSDRFGNHFVMISTSCLLPCLPLLWIFSTDFIYILLVQAVSGFAWSGFNLCTANYLYDIRPHRSDFATYAALQAALGASLVFIGALVGGVITSYAEPLVAAAALQDYLASALFVVFIASSVLRALITAWFIPRSVEPKIRPRPKILAVVYRVARFNAISGVSLDWLTVVKRRSPNDRE